MTVQERLASLSKQKVQLASYLTSKFEAQDWHAVQDAASDIREIEAAMMEIEKLRSIDALKAE